MASSRLVRTAPVETNLVQSCIYLFKFGFNLTAWPFADFIDSEAAPLRQHRTAAAPQLHTAPTTATNFALRFDFDIPTSPPAGGGAS